MKKLKQRIQQKLTSKQIIIISVLFAIFFTGACSKFIIGIMDNNIEKIVYLTFIFYLLFCVPFYKLDGNEKIREERKQKIKSQLKHNEWTLIPFYLYENDDTTIIRKILLEQRCEFYAKLNKNDSIVIKVVNGKYETICEKVVKYEYFYKKFTKKKRTWDILHMDMKNKKRCV